VNEGMRGLRACLNNQFMSRPRARARARSRGEKARDRDEGKWGLGIFKTGSQYAIS
jgi:hypothetical protein